MAETTVQDTEKQADDRASRFVKAAVEPKGGKNKPPKPPKAEPGTPDDELPLIDRLRSYPPSDWENKLILYGYRVEPITDRKLTGNKNYIRKWTVPIDIDDIKREFGSGVYKIQLNCLDETTRHQNVLGVQYVAILDEEYPPKIPMGEWVDDERNRDWWWAKPKLIAKHQDAMDKVNRGTEGAQVAEVVANAIRETIKQVKPGADAEEQKALTAHVIDALQSSQDRMFEILQAKGGGLADLVPLVKLILDERGSGSGDAMLNHVLEELREERKFTRSLLEKMNTPAEAKSFKDQVLEAKELVSLFRGGGSRSNDGGGGTDWAGIAREFGSKILEIADGGLRLWFAKQAQPKPGMRPQIPAPQGQAPSPPQETMQPMTPQQQEDALKVLNAQFGPLFDECVPTIIEIFRDPEGVGMEFREWFLERFGTFVYDQVVRLDIRTIMGVIDMRRQTAPPNIQRELQDLQPAEKVQKFIEEFLSSKPWSPPPDEDEQPSSLDARPQSGF